MKLQQQPREMQVGIAAALRTVFREGTDGALEDQDERIGWNEVARRCAMLDDALGDAGVGPGAIVATAGRNTVSAAATCVGVIASERCAMIVNPFQPAPAAASAARRGRPAAMLVDERHLDDAALEPGDHVLVVTADGALRRHRGTAPAASNAIDAALILSTSGTTGDPKSIPITSATLMRAIDDICAFNAGFGDRRRDDGSWAPLLQYSPLAHIGGALTLLRAVVQARAVVMFGKFDPHSWADALVRHRPYTTGLPPAMMRMVLEQQIPTDALASLVSVWSGSAPVKADTADAFTARYGLPVLGNYGATEFCGAVATWSLEDYWRLRGDRASATGRIHPTVANARVRDVRSDAILPLGDTGILELQVHRIGPLWLRTTDLAHLDADGFLYLHGRSDDAIVRGGFKIMPDTVAAALRRHPAVRDAAVVGIADARLGQVPVAAVELRSAADQAQLIAFVRDSLPAYFAPAAVRVVDALPRTPAMKIDRRAVRLLFEE